MLVVRVEESYDLRLRIAVHGAHAGAWQAHGDDLLGVRVRCESRSEGWIYRVLVGVGVRAAWSMMYVRSRSNPSCCRRSFCFDTRRRATHVMERRRATASGDVLRTSGEPQSSRARIMVHSQRSCSIPSSYNHVVVTQLAWRTLVRWQAARRPAAGPSAAVRPSGGRSTQ